MRGDWEPDIFSYLDYREFMRDYYEAAKEHTSSMSYRFLSRRAGFTSPNFVKMVMDGDRNLSTKSVRPVAQAFNLEGEEESFFGHLVAFNQARDAKEKNEAFERAAASQRFRHAHRIEQEMFEYLSRWYYPAIREMVARPDFCEEPDWIASQLLPEIRPEEAERALEVLLGLELLRREPSGELVRANPTLTTGHEVHSLAIGNYHRQMIGLGSESIERIPRAERDISAVTMCIDSELAHEIKERIHSFRESIIELCERKPRHERVFQLNLQLFPLTRSPQDDS